MAYQPIGVNFDGTIDYLTRGADLTGNADSKLVTGSFWFKPGGVGFEHIYNAGSSNIFQILYGSTAIRIVGFNSAGTAILNVASSGGLADESYHHCMFSFDMANASNRHLYIDDQSDLATVTTYTDAAIDFTKLNHSIGATVAAGSKWSGDLADVWIAPGQYIDLSVEANRRKFVGSGAATSVDLGSDGSTPTGTAPLIYLHGSVDTWHTNDGSGGGFTENGTLSRASEDPPDDGSIDLGGGSSGRKGLILSPGGGWIG